MSIDFGKLQQIFLNAVERHLPEDWDAYLDQVCTGERELRDQVAVLLKAHVAAGSLPRAAAQEQNQTKSYTSAPESAGAIIGHYKLVEEIGEGGMGTVWMAQQTEPVKRLVALKLIKLGMDTRQVIARFEAERQALALMDHVNIGRMLDAGATPEGRPYFVMDLVKGVPITKYCDEHHLTPRQRLELFVPVCQAIQHAHQKGVIHRDLKPSNVLVALYDGKPVPKVIDFGVAKAAGQSLTDKTLVTGFGNIVGTLEYMSPEQAEVNQLDIDTRSDIYALGVLLYELLAGSPPFSRKELEKVGMLEMLRVIREQEPSKPSTKLSTAEGLPTLAANRGTEPAKLTRLLRGELDWIVMKALEKDRNRRYDTANGFAMDVQRYLAGEPVLAVPASRSYRLRTFVRRHRTPVAAGGLLLLTLLAGIAGTTWGMWRAEQQRQLAVAESEAKNNALAAEQQARQQAFAALRSMTADVVERKIAQGMVLTEDDRAFLRGVIAQFDAFAAIKGNDADSRAARAEGRVRVGTIRFRLGELQGAEQDYNQALSIYKDLVADVPDRPEFRQELARTHGNRGLLLGATGRPQEAQRDHDEALSIRKQLVADFPARPEFRQDLATSHMNRGLLLSDTDRLREAEHDYDQAVNIYQRLVADFPSRREFRQDLAMGHYNRGILLSDTGRPKEAEQDFNTAIRIFKQLVADFPARPEFRQELARSHGNRANLLQTTNRLPEAEQDYYQALLIYKQLAADFPARPEYRLELARCHNNQGILLRHTGRPQEAEKEYDQALSIQKLLVVDFPARPDFRQELARTHNSRGVLLSNTNRLQAAMAEYEQALRIRRQLADDFPGQPDYRDELAGTYGNLAVLHRQQGDFAAAKRALLESQPHHQAALKANPRNPAYRQYYRTYLGTLTEIHAGLLEPDEAVRTAETIRDLGWDAPGDAYDAACALSLCVAVVAQHVKLDEKQRAEATQFFGDVAMKFLREAVRKGYKDASHMKTDTDLDPLRKRDDFQKLVAQLEGKRS